METGNTLSWTRFPAELRCLILNQLVQAAEQDGSSLAPYATVSSEWQAVIEPATFRSLNFTPALLKIPGFVGMANRAAALGLVRHICLFIPVAEYDCPGCERPEIVTDKGEAGMTKWLGSVESARVGFRTAISLLSGWKPNGSLSLDITLQSPSDASHYFKNIHVGYPGQTTTTISAHIHDPHHGWQNGRRVSLPGTAAIHRLFEDLEFKHDLLELLPQVTAVTSLSLRRQTTRRWGPSGVRRLVEHLVGLRELHYKPWREWERWWTEWSDDSELPTACPHHYLTFL